MRRLDRRRATAPADAVVTRSVGRPVGVELGEELGAALGLVVLADRRGHLAAGRESERRNPRLVGSAQRT